jgi:hypothetical protein
MENQITIWLSQEARVATSRARGAAIEQGQRHLTPLVGREEEIAMLMRRWAAGSGRVGTVGNCS